MPAGYHGLRPRGNGDLGRLGRDASLKRVLDEARIDELLRVELFARRWIDGDEQLLPLILLLDVDRIVDLEHRLEDVLGLVRVLFVVAFAQDQAIDHLLNFARMLLDERGAEGKGRAGSVKV